MPYSLSNNGSWCFGLIDDLIYLTWHSERGFPYHFFSTNQWKDRHQNIFMNPVCINQVIEMLASKLRNSTFTLLFLWSTGNIFHALLKEVFQIISLETISERPTSKHFCEPSVKSVNIDVIGTFWRTTTRELYHITWIILSRINITEWKPTNTLQVRLETWTYRTFSQFFRGGTVKFSLN